MAVPNIFAGTAGGTTAKLDANFAYFANALTVTGNNVKVAGALYAGAGVSTGGAVLLCGNYTSGAITVIGSEYAYGGPVIGYAVSPSLTAAAEFVSATAVNVGKAALTMEGNVLVYRSASASAVAEGAAVTLTERLRIDASGNMISRPPATPPTLTTNGQMVMNLTSNTNLRISVRGSDGVTRVANITLA